MASTQGKFSPLFGRRVPGGPLAIADIDRVPGDVWFVDSNASGAGVTTGHGYTPEAPFSTLAYAFSSALPNSGDVVYVMPGHAEDVDAAGDITMNIAGVKVVGLGAGSARPTFTFKTSTAATWLISAANVTVENVLITTSGTIDVVNGITISAADCRLVDVEVRESAADSQFVDPIIVTTGGARAKFVRYVCRSHASGDAIQSAVLVDAAVDGVEIEGGYLDGLFATGAIESTAAATNTVVRGTTIRQRHASQAAAVNLHASNTGFVSDVQTRITLSTAAGFNGAYVGAAAHFNNCKAANAAGTALSEPLPATGNRVSKSTGTLAATTISLFTVAGGRVLVTSMYGIVTTAITVANSYKIQFNPTTGTTVDMVAATDIGTTDTPVGDLLGFSGLASDSIVRGGSVHNLARPITLTIGDIEHVSAGTDGVITWVVEWRPLDSGATLVAA